MGVKSTITLTREDAVRQAVDAILDQDIATRKALLTATINAMSNTEIEDLLEEASDARAGGSGFDNFLITSDGQ